MMNNENNEKKTEMPDASQSVDNDTSKLKEPSKNSHGKDHKHNKELLKKISELESKLTELQDKYLRVSAEFDNYRKRTLKEKAELMKTAGEDSLTRILPVMDDFERAISSMDTAKEIEPVKEGIRLIYIKFKDILSQQGLKEIESINMEFNTDLHEAITKVPAPKEELKSKVLDVVQKGYYLNDKVIRFAKVIIGE
jgi:molecular chaperone GrpE